MHQSISLAGIESAEKNHASKTYKEKQMEERPNPMRPRLVDTYINSVLQNKSSDSKVKSIGGSVADEARIAAVE